MGEVIALKPQPDCPVRMSMAEPLLLLLQIEDLGWDVKLASGQLIINAGGKTIPKELSDRIKANKAGLKRLVRYCEAVT